MVGPTTPTHRVTSEPESPSDGSDDSHDDDYNPHESSIQGTPRSRVPYGSSIASEQRNEAAIADPNDGNCLLTLQSVPVQACHLVPRSKRGPIVGHVSLCQSYLYLYSIDIQLDSLEWWWGLPYKTFNVDTRYNIVFRACLHIIIDYDYVLKSCEQFEQISIFF